MTHRDKLNEECSSGKKMYLSGFGLFVLTIIAGIFLQSRTLNPKWVILPAIIGWLLCMVGALKLWYRLRCPSCQGRLGFLAMFSGKALWKLELLSEYKYCTYCGTQFDAPLK
jgi:hypothetical protein